MCAKVLIVDDELFIRVGLKSAIDWEKNGYEVKADVSNGQEALAMIKKWHPDIVLTDLKMPKMDGIELIQEGKKFDDSIQFIILSNYDDYENVRKALKLGAFDYIFKLSAKPEEILQVVTEAREQRSRTKIGPAEQKLLSNRIGIRAEKFRQLLSESFISEEEFILELHNVNINFSWYEPYRMACVAFDDIKNKKNFYNETNASLIQASMENLANEVIKSTFNKEVFCYEQGEIIILMNWSQVHQINQLKFLDEFDLLIKYIERYLNISVSCSISTSYQGIDQLKYALQECHDLLKLRFVVGGKKVFDAYDPHLLKLLNREFKVDLSKEIAELMKADIYELEEALTKYFTSIRRQTKVSEAYIKSSLILCFVNLNNKLERIGQAEILNKKTINEEKTLDQLIMNAKNLNELENIVIQVVRNLNSELNLIQRPEIIETMQIIKSNLSNNYSVSELAKAVHLSEGHLSSLFKSETSETIMQYTTRLKLELAKDLLRHSEIPVSEVADRIGISNPNYFSTWFKQHTGYSPMTFRKK